jgi:hypothetical protein
MSEVRTSQWCLFFVIPGLENKRKPHDDIRGAFFRFARATSDLSAALTG